MNMGYLVIKSKLQLLILKTIKVKYFPQLCEKVFELV